MSTIRLWQGLGSYFALWHPFPLLLGEDGFLSVWPSDGPHIQADITMHLALSDNMCKINCNLAFFQNISMHFYNFGLAYWISQGQKFDLFINVLVSPFQDHGTLSLNIVQIYTKLVFLPKKYWVSLCKESKGLNMASYYSFLFLISPEHLA